MKWRYQFSVGASPDEIERRAFAADRWFTFFASYRGRTIVDADWPRSGASIVSRFAALGPWVVTVRHTVTERQPGRLFRVHEEALGAAWVDDVEFQLTPAGTSTQVTLVTDQTSRFPLLRPFVLLMWPFNYISGRSAMKQLKLMVERGD